MPALLDADVHGARRRWPFLYVIAREVPAPPPGERARVRPCIVRRAFNARELHARSPPIERRAY